MQRESDLNAKGYSERDEKRILDALGRGLLKEFPNPDRAGCPGSDVLRKIASHEMPLPEAEKWLDHLTSCSPCYGDFSQLRKAFELRRKRTFLAVAASILVAAGIAGWVLVQRHNEPLVAGTAVLDLRYRSVPRSTEPNLAEPPLEVSRAATRWDIYLPLGSREGAYDLCLSTQAGEPVFDRKSLAVVRQGITALPVEVNLSSTNPGI